MDVEEEDKYDISQLENDIVKLIKEKLYTDLKIQVKCKNATKVFDAHALILATRSRVFADAKIKNLSFVVVDNVSIRGFEILLWYIYSNKVKSDCAEELIEVSKAARRLQIGGVSRVCKLKLDKCLVDINNVFTMFKASKYFKMEDLYSKCLRVIQAVSEDELFGSPGFQNAPKGTISTILALRYSSVQTSIEAVIRWLQKIKIRERSSLSIFGIMSLSGEEFLNLVEKFPSYFTYKEVASILSNLLRPGIMELPPWCEDDIMTMNETDGFLYSAYEELMENAMQVKTDCNGRFSKSYLFGKDGFEGSIIFEVKLLNSFLDQSHLVMLELAFGSSYAPVKNLELELLQLEVSSTTRKKIPFVLKSTHEHYYLILKPKIRFPLNHPFVFCLNLRTFGLKRWGDDCPVSDGRFRAVQVPGDIFYNMRLKAFGQKSVCLTLLSDWLVFLDPKCQEKRLLLTSFYFY